MSASNDPASVTTCFAAGSIDRILACTKRTPGLVDVPIGVMHRGGSLVAEHDVELREAKHKGVILIDEEDVRPLPKLGGQSRGQLQAGKPRSEHNDTHDREDSQAGARRDDLVAQALNWPSAGSTDRARMAESVDARDLGSRGATRPSSSLGPRTAPTQKYEYPDDRHFGEESIDDCHARTQGRLTGCPPG